MYVRKLFKTVNLGSSSSWNGRLLLMQLAEKPWLAFMFLIFAASKVDIVTMFQVWPVTAMVRRHILMRRCLRPAALVPSRTTPNLRPGRHSCELPDLRRRSRLLDLDTVRGLVSRDRVGGEWPQLDLVVVGDHGWPSTIDEDVGLNLSVQMAVVWTCQVVVCWLIITAIIIITVIINCHLETHS